MNTHTHTVPEWLTDGRVGTIVSPAEAAELPRGTYVVRNLTEVYRVSVAGGTRYPLSTDPAARRINMFGLALDAALKVVSVPGLHIDRHCLDVLPEGAVVTDRDGDLWSAVEVDGARGWVYTFDRAGNRRVGTPSMAYSSGTLLAAYGPVVGTHYTPGMYPAPTVVGGLYTLPNVATPAATSDADRFDDPDTGDNSLDLDDLYRAKPATIVADSDGDLWRRQVTDEGARAWVLVRENGVTRPFDLPAVAASSRRLLDRFGPIAYAPAADAKAALALTPRDVAYVSGDADPEHALNEYDADLDPDAVVEAALNRARVALTGDGEHVEVTITRDADGKVRVRTAVTGEVES